MPVEYIAQTGKRHGKALVIVWHQAKTKNNEIIPVDTFKKVNDIEQYARCS